MGLKKENVGNKKENLVVRYLLEKKAEELGNKVFCYWGDMERSFKSMNERANRMANGFLSLGVKKGDNVLIFLPNLPEYIDAWFGLAKIGAVEVPLNNAYKGSILQYVINNSEARMMVVHQNLLERVQFVQDKLQYLEKLVILGEYSESLEKLRFNTVSYQDLMMFPPSSPPDPDINFYDTMSIIYTSGTTGPSKGVLVPYSQVFATYQVLFKYSHSDDIFYDPFPLFHLSGQYAYYRMLVMGGSVAGRDVFSVSSFWKDVDRYHCTNTLLLGSMARFLQNQPPSESDSHHSLKRVEMVPLIDEVEDFKKRFALQVYAGYNMTEISMPICTDGYKLVNNKSCGRVRIGVQVRIVDEHDEELPPHQVGELIVRTDEPWTMSAGYWKMPEKTAEAWRNQWLHTGDGFYRDEKGNYYFVDRMKDAIRRRGENISSFEVEAEINSHPAVAESAVIAVPSEYSEDEIKAVVVLRPQKNLDAEELIRYLEPRMPYFMIPRYIEFVEGLPRTPTEKVMKQALRDRGVNENTWDMVKAGIKLKK